MFKIKKERVIIIAKLQEMQTRLKFLEKEIVSLDSNILEELKRNKHWI